MDEMKLKLSTKLMKGIAAKIITKSIFKKFGFKPKIQINEIDFEMIDGKVHFHVNVDGEIDNEDLLKATRLANLEEIN